MMAEAMKEKKSKEALLHVPPFVRVLQSDMSHRETCTKVVNCITCKVLTMLIDIKNAGNGGIFRPVMLLASVRGICNTFLPGQQEDSHEFLVSLIDCLETEFLNQFLPQKYDYISCLTSPYSRLFVGWQLSECVCLSCKTKSSTYSPFGNFQLDLHQHDVQQCVNELFSEDEVEKDCQECKCLKNMKKVTKIHQTPPVLILQVKRFHPESNVKNTSALKINQTITLPGTEISFSLSSVVLHLGLLRSNGHYVALTKCPDGSIARFDDAQIPSVSSVDSPEATQNCYILLYTRKTPPKVAGRAKKCSETSPHKQREIQPEQQKLHSSKLSKEKPFEESVSKDAMSKASVVPHNETEHCLPKSSEQIGKKGELFVGERAVSPLKIKIRRKRKVEDAASQSSYAYSLVKTTFGSQPAENEASIKQGPKSQKGYTGKWLVSPLKIFRQRRIFPKESSSQSSNEYFTDKQKRSCYTSGKEVDMGVGTTCGALKVTPLKITRTKRTEPKESSSQSSHDYNVVKCYFESTGVATEAPNDMLDISAPESQLTIQSYHHSISPASQNKTCEDNKSLFNSIIDPVLCETDIPGAVLHKSVIECNSKEDLKRFLKCRGLPVTGLKSELVERVKSYKELNGRDTMDPKVDGGRWYQLKKEAIMLSQASTSANIEFPHVGWKTFPSVEIPKNFNFGRAYDYLVESAPQYHAYDSINDNSGDEEFAEEADAFNRNKSNHPFGEENDLIHETKCLRRGFIFLKSKHTRNVKDVVKDSFYFVRCDMKASMESVIYCVKVAISVKSGNVRAAVCSCKQGALGHCSHVSGLLLYITSHVRLNGYGVITCTSRECEWNKGSPKRDPGKIRQNKYSSFKIDVDRRGKFDTRPHALQVHDINPEALNKFLAELSGNPYTTLFELHREIEYGDFTQEEYNLEILQEQCLQFNDNLRIIPNEAIIHHTNENHIWYEVPDTQEQSESVTWRVTRSYRITASISYLVLHLTSDEAKRSFLRRHLWMLDEFTSCAMMYGKNNEPKAREPYISYRRKIDPTAVLDCTSGFVVCTTYPGFGCSPDGIVYSRTHKPRLLEIKWPYVLKKVHPNKFDKVLSKSQQQNFCLVRKEDGSISLKNTHAYYFQIQLSLGILGFSEADFGVFSPEGFIITIGFDENVWLDMVPKLLEVHQELLVPEYFLMRTPRRLLPLTMQL